MGCAFRLRRIRETTSRFRAIFRVALSATHPHPETATHYSAKNRVAVSQALDATLAQGVSPTAAWSFKNVPNDYKRRTMATTQVEDGQRATSRTNKLA